MLQPGFPGRSSGLGAHGRPDGSVEGPLQLWPQTPLRLRLAGQMAASDATGDVALPKVRKTRALLAILALAAPQPVLREQVTRLLWSRREREQARASLRQCVHELQEMFETLGLPPLETGRQHLKLMAGTICVDVQTIGASAPLAGPVAAVDFLHCTLLDDLAGLDPAFDDWIAAQTARLHRDAAEAAWRSIEQLTEPAAVIAALRRLVAATPSHEAAWRRLIQAYAADGQNAAAIDAYEQCVQALALAAGGRPSAETVQATERARAREGALTLRQEQPARGQSRAGMRGAWVGVAVFRASDPQDERSLAIGLAEEIASALARFRWLNLVAPGSIAALASEPPGQGARWRELDLDFLLDGTVQRSGGSRGLGQIRVTVRLLDMRCGGEVVWAHRFDGSSADLFTLQDEIAAETAARVDPALMMHESRRVASRPMGDATAYELLLRAIPSIYRLAEPGYAEAGALLAKAAERAPDNAAIFAWWACWYAFLVGQGWASDPAAAMRRAGALAEQAVALDPTCARALSVAGYVRSFLLHKDIGETIGLHERALALNPNMPFGWAVSALSLAYAGDHEAAVARGERAKLLSPFDPHSFFFDSALMVPHLMLREFETVAMLGRQSLALNPAMSATWKGLLSALGHLSQTAEASEVMARLMHLEPGFTIADARRRSALRRVEDLHLYLEGLRRAGLPEG